ncbi:MAG: ribbon-helix-helix protein, CopG family [Candidatus Rokubacteria bacterium]|nr:ribbon-helix-helix protein, CopG family [Candidatus Rokubacteria bacterium]
MMISLPDDFVKRVDPAACAQRRLRSELIREALRAHLSRVGFVG